MGITIYSGNFDLNNITRNGTLSVIVDSGTEFNINLHGSDNPSTSGTGASGFNVATYVGVDSIYFISGDVDHVNPVNPVPPLASILSVVIECQASYSLSSSAFGTVDDAGGTLHVVASVDFNAELQPVGDSNTNIVDGDADFDDLATPNTGSVNAGIGGSPILSSSFDFSMSPLSYSDFISQFATVSIFLSSSPQPGNSQGSSNCFPIPMTANYNANVNSIFSFTTNNWSMTVTWSEPLTITLDTPTEPVEEDTPIEITTPDADLTEITSVTISYIDSNGDPQTIDVPPELWIIITVTLFTFTMPGFPADMTTFEVLITSTEFSGSVTLGKLTTINFENAPGIYTLVPGKTSDTLYDISDPGSTVEVKIPNPHAKGGFIGG